MWPLATASMFPWPAPSKLRHNSLQRKTTLSSLSFPILSEVIPI